MRLVVLPVILFGLIAGATQATTVYECVGPEGSVRFQDRPCAAGERSRRRVLTDDPVPAPSRPEPRTLAGTEPGPARHDEAPTPTQRAPPGGFLCQREEDGSRYLSDTGIGERRAVPLAMLGIPGGSLGDAYARDRVGVSAPGLRQIPTDASPSSQIGAAYVWIEDSCEPIDGWRRCAELQIEIADAERQLARAFSDTSAQIRQQIEALRIRGKDCALQ